MLLSSFVPLAKKSCVRPWFLLFTQQIKVQHLGEFGLFMHDMFVKRQLWQYVNNKLLSARLVLLMPKKVAKKYTLF